MHKLDSDKLAKITKQRDELVKAAENAITALHLGDEEQEQPAVQSAIRQLGAAIAKAEVT